MLNRFTNIQGLMGKLLVLGIVLALISACASTPNSSDGGQISTAERLARIKETGTSRDPKQEDNTQKEQKQNEESADSETSDNEASNTQEEAASEPAPPQQTRSAPSRYTTLPPAKTRTHQTPPVSRQVKGAYKDAIKSLNRNLESKKFDDALQQFKALEAENPQLSGPSTNIGLIYLHQGKYKEAEESFKKALSINNENEYAHNNLGLAYREQGKFAEAKASYLEAAALNPKYEQAHYNLGVLSELYLRDIELSIRSFEYYKLASKNPDKQVDTWLLDLNNRYKQQQAEKAAAQAAAQAQQQSQQQAEQSPEASTESADQDSSSETPEDTKETAAETENPEAEASSGSAE